MAASLRQSGSAWQSHSSKNAFTNDEEVLKWAALEKLPTYNRVRRGILIGTDDEPQEVDIESLGSTERKNLIDRLVNSAGDGNENFLLKMKSRLERVGIENPTIEVRFENLEISSDVYVGSRGVPTIPNFFMNKIEGLFSFLHILPNRKRAVSILHNISGIIKPNRMTLLLGPPGSGKTTLQLALAGKLDKKLKVSGEVTYNGHKMDEFVPQRTSAYISQHDQHIAEMTVRETLAFSARCQGVGTRYEMLTELSRREKAANIKPDPDVDIYMKATSLRGQESIVTDYILKMLGLDTCADTLVGDAMIRGISGGQKKRVTTGEMLVGPAKAMFMDEISTGLDSSTTFQIINSIQKSIHILGGTALIALLQPAPEIYDLFDDILLLSDGHIVYQGPREFVLTFFESMGFTCPTRKGIADFLQEVTSRRDQQQYWASNDEPYLFISATQFASAFLSFHIGKGLESELQNPFDKNKNHPAALATSKYGPKPLELLKACFSRELLLMKRNSFIYIFKFFQLGLMATITMTVFLRTNMKTQSIDDGLVYLGALYMGLLVHFFNGYSELTMTIAKLPVFYKQRDILLFPAWAYAIPTWITKIPISLLECGIWVLATYYAIGFDPSILRMLWQFLVFSLTSQMSSSLFRFIAACGREKVVARIFSTFVETTVLVLGGFIISKNDLSTLWIWGYWASPMMYAQNAIAENEFLGKRWMQVQEINNFTRDSLGAQIIDSRGLHPEDKWFWIGISVLLAYIMVLNFLYSAALTCLNPTEKGQPMLLPDRSSNEIHEPSSKRKKLDQHEESNGNVIARMETIKEVDKKMMKGMTLPFIPLSVAFENIKYSIDMPKEMKLRGVKQERLMLLNGVSGLFRPGVLTAIMGVSGTGKTTLMDVLAGRKAGGHVEGSIFISGHLKKQETFARISGYCEQSDIHSPHITVHESLMFSALLRLSSDVGSEIRKMFIEEVVELVELTPLMKTLVGGPGVNGLSTEQRKRLTIGVELVANPSILFMDEPTSGLDARAAAIVMRTIRNTVDTGRTVVCTIHQPSIDIFESFDELFLMKSGGEEIYVGPLGHNSCDLISYFEGIDGIPKIKESQNPATWMLEITNDTQEKLGINFAEIYKNSDLFRRNRTWITELSTQAPGSRDLSFQSRFAQSLFKQCAICLWKQHKSYWRNTSYTAVRLLFTAILSLMLGSISWKLASKTRTKQNLFNSMGSMYSAILFIGIQNAQTVQTIVDVERAVYYREKAAGMYSATPYVYAQVAIEIPYTIVQTFIYGIITYIMMDCDWTAAKFVWFLFFTFFTFLCFTYYGMMTASITPNSDVAAVLAAAFYSIWNLFTGFVIPPPRLPIWWRWYCWACPVSWSLYGLVGSQYGDNDDIMDNGESVKDFLRRYFGYKKELLCGVAAAVIVFPLLFVFIFAHAIKTLSFQKR